MGKDLTEKIVRFIKKKEVATLDDIRKEFPKENYKIINYHISKALAFGVKKIKNGLYISENFSDFYLLLMKLNKDNILAYHTALEFYGLGHSTFYTAFIMNTKSHPDIKELEGKSIKYTKPTIYRCHTYHRNNKTFKVTPLEATFIDCLLNLKYCGGFEEFFRCIKGIDTTSEIKLNKNEFPTMTLDTTLNLNYIFELLKKYKIKKLYNLVGFTLESLKKHWNINVPETFLNKLKKHIREKTVILEKSYSNTYVSNKDWNVKFPKELISAITGEY